MGKYKTFGSRFDRVHRNDLNANFAAVEADINAQKGRVDDLITGTPQPSEVVDSRGGFPVLGERLNDLSLSLAQIAYYATSFGAKGDGTSDDTLAIQNAIDYAFTNGGGRVLVSSGDFKTSAKITVKQKVTLVLNYNTTILPSGDFDVFHIKPNGGVTGGKIDAKNVANFTKSMIYLEAITDRYESDNEQCGVTGTILQGNKSNPTGIGIKLFAGANGKCITWATFSKMNIANLSVGILLKVDMATVGSTWVTANTFDSIGLTNLEYGIRIEGSSYMPNIVSGNNFTNFQIQPTARTKRVIYCEGGMNQFIGTIWDVYVMPEKVAVEFTANAEGNTLQSGLRIDDYVMNLGKVNQIISGANQSIPGTIIRPNSTYSKMFVGDQDDYLAHGIKRGFTITQISGPIAGGSLSPMLDINGDAATAWVNITADNPVVLEINMEASPATYLQMVGINTGYSRFPKNIKIEGYDGTSLTWTTLLDKANNTNPYIISNTSYGITNCTKLKITFSEAINADGTIRFNRIFAQASGKYGMTWFPRNGGSLYGDLTLVDSYLGIGKLNGLPTASATHRGKIIRNEGGAGVEDKMYICKKLANDTYSWVQIDL
jgi:hypothetical protein